MLQFQAHSPQKAVMEELMVVEVVVEQVEESRYFMSQVLFPHPDLLIRVLMEPEEQEGLEEKLEFTSTLEKTTPPPSRTTHPVPSYPGYIIRQATARVTAI